MDGLLANKLLRTKAYIDGEWSNSASGKTYDVTDPATGDVIASVADCDGDDTRRAIEAAERAQPAWAAKTGKERAAILRKWFDLMMANQEELAVLMTREQGKPLAESRGEIVYAASFLEWFGEEAKRTYGDVIPAHKADSRIVVIKQPIGVGVAITPWNFPSAMITRKAGPALAAGNAIVIKPAKVTPLSALALAELAEQAGVPKGILSVVAGTSSSKIGGEMTSNPTVRKLSFTGSTEIGKVLLAQCAETVKKTSMELGGNAPFIVFDDADLDEAVTGAILCKFRNAGQTCVCANRIFVQDGIYDAFMDKFQAATAALKVGNGMEDGVSMGPLIDEPAMAGVDKLVQGAKSQGAKVALGGNPHDLGHSFYTPSILTGVTMDMDIANEEIFGPVATIIRFKDDADVVRMANDTNYGLAAYFYSRDIGRTWRISEGLEYGIVGINSGIISTEVAPFGGVKESGSGREGSYYGMDDWMEVKYLSYGGI